MRTFARLSDDIGNAGNFYSRVSNTQAVQEDETLQIIDEEVLFGEALACRGESCHLVFTRPVSQIAHHWLATIARHIKDFEGVGSRTPAGEKFISDLKTTYAEQDSVWTKVSTLYCRLEPEGKYNDLSGSVVLCHDSPH